MCKLAKNFTKREFGQNLDVLGIREHLRDQMEDYFSSHEKQCAVIGEFVKRMDAFLFTAIELSKDWPHIKDPTKKYEVQIEQLVYYQMFCE